MRNLTQLYHVGTLNIKDPAVYGPAGDSIEGNGLSVSVHPKEWTRIARLGGQDTFLLQKSNPNFFDAYNSKLRKQALKWAQDCGFIEPVTLWKSWLTDEEGEEYFFTHESKELALAESGDESEVEEFTGYKVTGMIPYFKKPPSPSLVEDYACIWFAEAAGFDGVWWEETLDPEALSAPRGVIFQDKINEWMIKKAA